MSVTIRIAHDKDQSIVQEFECNCVWNCPPNPDCPECKGTGKVVFRNSRWEVNLCNANFAAIFAALGLPHEEYGEIDGRALLRAIESYFPGLAVRESRRYRSGELMGGEEGTGALHIEMGLDEEAVRIRLDKIREIAEEAARREEKVVWC